MLLDRHRLLKSTISKKLFLVSAAMTLVASSWSRAELLIEPVFNRVDGTGGAENGVGVRQAVNGVQASLGLEPLWTAAPNEIFTYVAGDPRKFELDHFFFYNDTDQVINGFGLNIIGTGTDTDDPRTIVRDASVDARFGDVDGDGSILSDIFTNYSISDDGKTIEFTGGMLAPGERFTDIHLALSDNPPDLAGIDSWIIVVPEPNASMLALGLVAPLLARRRKR
ncbi:MAG: hypothetical protein KDB27_34580 [Planctomycetales bacterium]|nr:hypothetical protein [Planctomycetales bacterium]